MQRIENEYSNLSDYARYNEATKQVEIDYALMRELEASSDEKLIERVKEYVSKLED
jgi:hypothetical protein